MDYLDTRMRNELDTMDRIRFIGAYRVHASECSRVKTALKSDRPNGQSEPRCSDISYPSSSLQPSRNRIKSKLFRPLLKRVIPPQSDI